MRTLDSLVPTAVVGTARRDLDVAESTAVASSDVPPAQALLAAAARAAVIDRVAIPRGAAVDDPGPEPETVAAPRSPAYLGTLHQAIGGRRWPAVAESLRHLAATGQRLPVGVLPALLREAETRQELRTDLWPVLGARGRWLVGRNPHWDFEEWFIPDLEDMAVWETGSLAQRVAWLRAVRAAEPERARRLVDEAPAGDATTRAALLGVLREGLSMADEPVLEVALDDRAKDVRALARNLLAALPDSAFVARMRARLKSRLDLKGGHWVLAFGGLGPVDVRDGLAVDPRERPPGAAAVRALIGGVPLVTWAEDHKTSAAELLKVRAEPMELGPLLGLRDASIRERDAGLARAILLDHRCPPDPDLVAVLDPRTCDEVLARRVRIHEPPDLVGELRVQGIGHETAAALLEWAGDNRSAYRRAAILGVLGEVGPLDTEWGDLASALRQRAAGFTGADRSRALDAAMTINLRRSLRAEAAPPVPPAIPDNLRAAGPANTLDQEQP